MKTFFVFLISISMAFSNPIEQPRDNKVVLGNERLISEYNQLIDSKNIGVITNQTGVDSLGQNTFEKLYNYENTNLVAIYTPEHGLDGLTPAGKYVESYTDSNMNIPVYSLYGKTRMPSEDMLKSIDVLIFDIQDIGSRTYTYISTLNYCMIAAQKYNKQIVVLDRPNPIGANKVEGFVLEDRYKTFVGVDNLPMSHGMTAGELAKYFNRNIGANLTVIPMLNYNRDMIYQDTNLPWRMTSPNIPTIKSAFGYMATGIGEGTGIGQGDKFTWIGGKGIDSNKFAQLLNNSSLEGVEFIAENKGDKGGVRLNITDYHKFNPCRVGTYALTYAHDLTNFKVPKSGKNIIMFEKIMGTSKYGKMLEMGYTPEQIVDSYQEDLNKFKVEREKYLIY
ncbi:MAG: DUF1343 domain-containing protein [Tepidibacter sp.]|uniref:DUF1343 domain-containing protein n=1 Tax=Tepidibacter sp. TaxID=2529387 RepID=UPI0025D8C9CE|nr:DUF1343 domain-containing protein [Tepidibacter sp.]MCT4509973.1 DUF1343 domain-containing protein [Tepidibacter sp.]